MKKNKIRMLVDIIMVIVLFSLYDKNAISMRYHEVAGLVLFGLFICHLALQWKWIKRVTSKIFSRELPAKTKVCFWVDILLLISLTFVTVSGVLISKTILTNISASGIFWKMGHYFAAALSVILCGVHLGLHWGFIKGMACYALRKYHGKAPQAIAACLAALIMVFGAFQFAASDFSRWLAAPFIGGTAGEAMQRETAQNQQNGQQGNSSNDAISSATNQAGSGSKIQQQSFQIPQGNTQNGQSGNSQGNTQNGQSGNSQGNTQNGQSGNSQGNTQNGRQGGPQGEFKGERPDRFGGFDGDGPRGAAGGEHGSGGLLRVISTICKYFSISVLFAGLTVLIENGLKKRKINQMAKESAAEAEVIDVTEFTETKEDQR
ncbi:DUF4405 domain-containing protein [Acidaminobacterium chupaoyuni]